MRPTNRRWLWAIGVLVAALLSGCESPALMDGRYGCSPSEPGSCPPGWQCAMINSIGEFRCYRDAASVCGDGGCECGDGDCEVGEDSLGCPADCYCGNGTCEAMEDEQTCQEDCVVAECGDGICGASETGTSCPVDCAGTCGDGTCQVTENYGSCPQDCTCGNGICEATENVIACPSDCTDTAVCGDGVCNGTENAATCAADCATSFCGDGTCNADEDVTNCPADCCIDVICDLYPQCGCQVGQKCTIGTADNRACLAAGSSAQGQTCAWDTECIAGTFCLGAGAQDMRCMQFCASDNDCPGSGGGGRCVHSLVDATQQPIPGAEMCSTDCNPASTNPVGCPTGWACHLQYVDDNADTIPDFFFTDCANDAGTGTGVGQCDNVTTFCAPGYFCYTTWGDCIRTCRVGGSDCPGGMVCSTYADAAIVGSTEYGYCE